MEEIHDDTETPVEVPKKVNRIYLLILGIPVLVYSLTLTILSISTSLEPLADGWQIWVYIFSIPGLGFIGGFILKKNEIQKTLLWSSFFVTVYTAITTSALSGGFEIIRGATTGLEIFYAFLGGILYGGGFGLFDCLLLILATLGAFYLKLLIQNNIIKKNTE
jgi:hypothetical protein